METEFIESDVETQGTGDGHGVREVRAVGFLLKRKNFDKLC